jgi:hypothetical protein
MKVRINGAIPFRGKPAEGLLMNVRMINAVFEDTNRPDFDPAANARRDPGIRRRYRPDE